MTQKRYITTAIDYVNSVPHIGTAYEKIGADVLARFFRLCGDEVRFQMGNDEHSSNVQKSAREKGLDPKVYCDEMRPKFETVWNKLAISNDQFIQTTEPRHHKSVQALFQKIYDNGDIYEKDYEGWYCESCEAFYTEKDLEDGLCPNHKKKPTWLTEKNYFFKLTKYRDFLLKLIKDNPKFIVPAKRRNEILSFIESGLEDISVSRSSFDWGIPLPIAKDHVVYVWFDALINYITGVGFGEDDKLFNQEWQNVLHVIGKDITRFHCIIWPSMLQSAGLPLPQQILGHGFVNMKGEKMSKSLGNVVTPLDIIDKYPDFGADALRYYLLRGSSFGDDGDFTWESFIERYNADLANGLGNLVSRTLGMVWRYQNGQIDGSATDQDSKVLLGSIVPIIEEVKSKIDPQKAEDAQFHFALEKIWSFISSVDQYIDERAPWTLAKEEKTDELSVVMTTLVEAIRRVTVLASLIIPIGTQKIWQGLGFESFVLFGDLTFEVATQTPKYGSSYQIPEKKLLLYPRIQKEDTPVEKPVQNTVKKEPDNLIDIKDFTKVELKVATILSAEKVEGADKLLKLQVEVGEEKRQVVAGIAEHYSPESLLQKQVVLVTNLKPATIRGVESHGMLLAAKKGKKLFVVSPESEIPSGAKVG